MRPALSRARWVTRRCAAVFAALSVIGPWVVGGLGGIVAGLAGGRLLDDPKSVLRAVSGLTLAGFVAGFFALFSMAGGSPWSSPGQLSLSVPKERVAAVRQQVGARLERAGIEATVGTNTGWVATGTGDGGERQSQGAPGAKADRSCRQALTSDHRQQLEFVVVLRARRCCEHQQ
ncbi:hypothetical protein ACFXJ5_08535 [Streptomyces sp. NPDC059373]